MCILITVASFISLKPAFINNVRVWHNYRIRVSLNLEQLIDDGSYENKTIKQEFYVSRNFNYISLVLK